MTTKEKRINFGYDFSQHKGKAMLYIMTELRPVYEAVMSLMAGIIYYKQEAEQIPKLLKRLPDGLRENKAFDGFSAETEWMKELAAECDGFIISVAAGGVTPAIEESAVQEQLERCNVFRIAFRRECGPYGNGQFSEGAEFIVQREGSFLHGADSPSPFTA